MLKSSCNAFFSKSRLQFTNKLFEEHDNIIQATENRFQQETEIKDGEIRYLQRQVVHFEGGVGISLCAIEQNLTKMKMKIVV